MEIEEKLERIENKIENYNEKIDNISSLITTLIHSFQQNQLPTIKSEILAKIEEKFSDNSSFPDIEDMKSVFDQIKNDFSESQNLLNLKIVELEKTIKKALKGISDKKVPENNGFDNEKLNNIEDILTSLSDKIENYRSSNISEESAEFPVEKIDAITTLITAQNNANKTLFDNLENQIKAIETNLISLNTNSVKDEQISSTVNVSGLDDIKDRFNDLNLSITSVLSAIKIIDKKYVELKSFQDVIDKLTTDVVSPVLLASNEIKSFVSKTSENFNAINDFVKEYNREAFNELQSKIQSVDDNVDKLCIDVNKLYDLVDDFKTNSDLSNHTISDNMDKIENMICEYNNNLTELTKNATADVIRDGVKSLNDEFYIEILNLFNTLSFDTEAEDIKDFLEGVLSVISVKTDENSEKLNNIMLQFKNLLHKIEGIERTQNSISDYLKPEETDTLEYSFDDIQTDLAKMRLVLNDISKTVSSSDVVDEISAKIKQTSEQIENFSKLLNSSNEQDENVADLKAKLEALNTQVYDISLRTNKLILTNEDSNIELKNNLELFKDVFDKANPEKLYELFYELTNYFNDTNDKISVVKNEIEATHAESSTIKNALIYVGEWLDKATTVLEEIRTNTENSESHSAGVNITSDSEVVNALTDLKKQISMISDKDNTDVLTEIKEHIINLSKIQSKTVVLFNGISDLQRSISVNVNKIYEKTESSGTEIQNRLNLIEEKLDKILAAQEKQPKSTTKTSTTQIKAVEKRLSALEDVLEKISEKLLKE